MKTDQKQKLNKVMTEKEAVYSFLKDGDSFTVGGFLGNRESDCVFREIARQKLKHLHYIEESCTFAVNILIALGALDRMDLAYMPHRQMGGIFGLPALNSCLEKGLPKSVNMGNIIKTEGYTGDEDFLEVVDWTNFMVSLRFVAGALNIPFMPCRSGLGSDFPKYNKEIKIMQDPYKDETIALVPALNPDVAFISVQRADMRGNGQVFGQKGVDEWKARAAKHVVLLTEELVSTEKITENPSNTLIPSYCSDAVVVLPYNSHPQSVYGVHETDELMLLNNLVAWQTPESMNNWMEEWVFGCKDHYEYCEKVGWEKLNALKRQEGEINKLPA